MNSWMQNVLLITSIWKDILSAGKLSLLTYWFTKSSQFEINKYVVGQIKKISKLIKFFNFLIKISQKCLKIVINKSKKREGAGSKIADYEVYEDYEDYIFLDRE